MGEGDGGCGEGGRLGKGVDGRWGMGGWQVGIGDGYISGMQGGRGGWQVGEGGCRVEEGGGKMGEGVGGRCLEGVGGLGGGGRGFTPGVLWICSRLFKCSSIIVSVGYDRVQLLRQLS